MRNPLFLAAASLLSLGCHQGGLASLTDGTLSAQIVGTPLFLHVGESGSSCPSLSSASASLNATALHTDSLGGSGGGLLGGCTPIQFSGTAQTTDAAFAVSDDTETWTMSVPGYFAARGLEITAPGTTIHPGDTVVANAVPATDTFNTIPGVSASFISDDGATGFTVKSGVSVSGSTFQFVVPAASPAIRPDAGTSAPGTLTIMPGLSYAHVATCSGPSACSAQLDAIYAVHVTLETP